MQLSISDCCHIAFALELIMLRAGILYTLLGAVRVGHKLIVYWLLLAHVIVHSFYFIIFFFLFLCVLSVGISL